MRIIIAEDEQRSREGLCRLVEGLEGDYQLVGRAANGSAALDMILQLKPDAVFTDIKMPIMDGIELITHAWPTASRRNSSSSAAMPTSSSPASRSRWTWRNTF